MSDEYVKTDECQINLSYHLKIWGQFDKKKKYKFNKKSFYTQDCIYVIKSTVTVILYNIIAI